MNERATSLCSARNGLRIIVLQPTIPEYRLPLFERLSHSLNIELRVYGSEDYMTAAELKNGNRTTTFSYSKCKSKTFAGGRVVWQSGLHFGEWLRAGDVLVLCGNPRYLSNYPLILRARQLGIGVVWWGQGWSVGSRGFFSWLRQKIMKFADVLLLYTDEEVRDYVKLGFDSGRVFATNNAIDQEQAFKLTSEWNDVRLMQFRSENEIKDRRVLIFCGRLIKKTEVDFLVGILPKIVQRWPKILLAVIGDGPMRADLQAQAFESGVQDHIRWLGSIYDEQIIAPWFLSSEVFVYPGAIGLSLLHSMGYGLPVLTHSDRVYHGPEFSAIRDGKNSLTFRKGDEYDFIEKLGLLMDNDAVRRDLSRSARLTVEDKYSITEMVTRFVGAIHAASQIATSKSGA